MIRRFLKSNEDSFTSTVFSQLLHLPFECMWAILKEASFEHVLPPEPGEPVRVEFWPHWDPENTINSTMVEPDLFFRFADFDLIVEAKRWDQGQQDRAQWERELQAYVNEYGDERKRVYMLALGGLHQFETERLPVPPDGADECQVVMMQWNRILQATQRLRTSLERVRFPSSSICAQIRTLDHVIDAFAHHGFATGRWYQDLPFYLHPVSNLPFPFSFSRDES